MRFDREHSGTAAQTTNLPSALIDDSRLVPMTEVDLTPRSLQIYDSGVNLCISSGCADGLGGALLVSFEASGAGTAEGLRTMLQSHVDDAGARAGGPERVVDAKAVDPEVLVLDVSVPPLNANDVARELRIAGTQAQLVILTLHREVTPATRALEAGASVFVLNQSAASQLVSAIGEALKQGTQITTENAAELIETLPAVGPYRCRVVGRAHAASTSGLGASSQRPRGKRNRRGARHLATYG